MKIFKVISERKRGEHKLKNDEQLEAIVDDHNIFCLDCRYTSDHVKKSRFVNSYEKDEVILYLCPKCKSNKVVVILGDETIEVN